MFATHASESTAKLGLRHVRKNVYLGRRALESVQKLINQGLFVICSSSDILAVFCSWNSRIQCKQSAVYKFHTDLFYTMNTIFLNLQQNQITILV